MKCDCDKYKHLELHRKSITKRIKKTQNLKEYLEIIESKREANNSLYRCPTCGKLWQSSIAWNWQGKEYLFEIPEVGVNEWMNEQFVQPDELIIYSYHFQRYSKGQNFTPRDIECKKAECCEKAIQYSVFCLWHQFESLNKFPNGKLFEPYYLENYLEYLKIEKN